MLRNFMKGVAVVYLAVNEPGWLRPYFWQKIDGFALWAVGGISEGSTKMKR